jgi:hypothetical protein
MAMQRYCRPDNSPKRSRWPEPPDRRWSRSMDRNIGVVQFTAPGSNRTKCCRNPGWDADQVRSSSSRASPHPTQHMSAGGTIRAVVDRRGRDPSQPSLDEPVREIGERATLAARQRLKYHAHWSGFPVRPGHPIVDDRLDLLHDTGLCNWSRRSRSGCTMRRNPGTLRIQACRRSVMSDPAWRQTGEWLALSRSAPTSDRGGVAHECALA